MKIYYNPQCSKCRIAKETFKGENLEIIEYLKTPPKKTKLQELLKKLNLKAEAIIRKNEDEFTPFKGKEYTEDEWLDILVRHPRLLQRPIIVNGHKAVVGRTAEALEYIKN
jgi:arsenate reductase (glutaredoxin)